MCELINFTHLNDCEAMMVWQWRNDERVAKYMKTKFISFKNHLNFIKNLKNDTSKRYFLLKSGGIYIGVVDFIGIRNDICEFGIYANPNIFSVGKILMHTVLAYAFKILNVKIIKAYAYNENQKAIALYKLFKFEITEYDSEITRLELRREAVQILMKNYKFLNNDENKQILEIRNLEYIRNMSLNDKVIDFNNHIKWIKDGMGGGK
ncbi:UDP-4-amino-4,6-dideoxy-N-acetyl-beta-L-altrosamine N-acetyltransferase [Campylobacter sp. faydin G-140]|uniref:UDP-4-amino-4, 6-dideoxy-N-acetyl-beta-L-altrosamine N-acetyltransferase n=1 Tax=Campylobacter anatolicus TaxID=2829105 RepID=UPI001B94D818|nr:UDP-4-amino-4,6-dideoxy-N-acetyl-beta-L-altrosamine N-acetyltransferase [Campylobacter anatolicus]MBR8462247.1 UDP-4-amino-4,6-dideoxy-N-acetyl-beta-L-altrosamine N-acetyltransferase [Campylobacter anatolicus]MBR8465387.1 UDP-4-amino-4,6-dideoxy-N-acetyl-beta-L-altrosamine N-acetyltransferase [Campylobacter anatolicus]